MKLKISLYTLFALSVFLLTNCAKDNYEPPKSMLSGKVTYNGTPVPVRTNGVQLELWQHGYQLFTKIPVYVAQDGSYSAALFDGDYKLVRLRGNGPWADVTDSIDVKVKGNTVVDVPVTPYFNITAATFTYAAADKSVTATFTVNQVVTGKTVELSTLMIGATEFVDNTNLIISTEAAKTVGSAVTVKISLDPANYTAAGQAFVKQTLEGIQFKKYAFARIGVKTTGTAERIFTQVQKITIP
ncbi:DUF3823 domain-containing protein [Hufsiella ginkgonis]|uniref:DUF3823 domain-containing protein n=1 Tax=Hufsiella ginkgonis TaxID=2695274 RepID=A0A7K1Y1L5_9SPHI|nr:DUF3823 domain-containing protein [Hufsiella ginkgonis]MXV17017.1 DUF3823 domain-containing protein [Hufsiella ginkgonis]